MRSILLTGCFLILFQKAKAQPHFPSFLHRLSPEQGLSQATNSFVLHDSRGFVWVSSIDGLNRYDGHSVRVYRPNPVDGQAIGGKNMQSPFFEAHNGDLWFCTYEAINRYRRLTDDFEVFRIRDVAGKIIENGYYAFHFDRDGRLWLRAGEDGLYWFDTRTEQQSLRKGSLNGVRCFVDTISSGEVRGIWSSFFRDSTGICYTELNDTAGVVAKHSYFVGAVPNKKWLGVSDICLESDTLLWLASVQGLVAYNPKKQSFKVYQPRAGRKERFWSILRMNDTVFAVSTPVNGVWLFDKTKQVFTQQILPEADNPMSLPDREVEEMYRDNAGNIWLSHWNTGLSHAHLQKQKFEQIRLKSLFPAIQGQAFEISSLVEVPKGEVWCATEGAGILALENGRAVRQFLPDQQVVFLMRDHEGNGWALTKNGVFTRKASGGDFKKVLEEKGLAYGLETSDKRLLFSGEKGVFEIKKMSGSNVQIVPAIGFESWRKAFVDWMYEDNNGTFYFGKDVTTLCILRRNGQTKEYPFGYIKAAYEDSNGRNVWLATTSGLVLMDKTTFDYTLYDESNGLPNQYLYSVIPDNSGALWLSSNKGIVRFDTLSRTARRYGAADGVWQNEFYSKAWLRTSTGEIWMGNRNVINVFRPEAIRDVQNLPNIQITHLKVNDLDWAAGTYIGECRELEFSFSQNTLSFDFVALEYSDPANNRLKYRMDGYDDQWIEVPLGAPGFARYAQLPPGLYTFKILAANSDGVWNPRCRELLIRILPPYWRTWWFVLLVIIALLGTGYSFYKYRLSQLKRDYSFKQKTVESEMKALRAQMNPHFIFNSLNSINAYILRNEGKIASSYLSEFAILIRQILDYSSLPLIRLDQEIDFLNNYLAIESLRMDGRLAWEIHLEDDLDDFGTEVPPMIIQPFVENAIWHGLSPKPTGGRLLLSFKKMHNILICTIEDNGVGRSVAKQKHGYQSKGQSITFERLSLYDQQYNTQSDYVTEDLRDSNGHPSGTRVILRLGMKVNMRH